MSFKAVILNNPCGLSIKNRNLLVKLKDEEVIVPMEDIATILIDNPQISLTREVLTSAAQNNIALIVSDEKHMPCGIMLPCYQYFKSSYVVDLQVNISKYLKDSLWQKLIKTKIKNQSLVLKFMGKEGVLQLENLIPKVLVGDKNNVEAIGARIYFISLFDKNFNRSSDNLVNAMLNYGYAIIRSSLAKSLTSKGFHCSMGIHHSSILNNFNLADDLIEPFRGIVDYHVNLLLSSKDFSADKAFCKEHKEYLVNLLHQTVLTSKGALRIINATDMLVDSLIKAYKENDSSKLLEITFHGENI